MVSVTMLEEPTRLDEAELRGEDGTWRAGRPIREGRHVTIRTALPVGNAPAAWLWVHPVVSDVDLVRRYLREARSVQALEGGGRMRVLATGHAESGECWTVTEPVPGEPLDQLLAREGALPVSRAVRLLSRILEALEPAHDAGVTHGAVAPHHVYVAAEDAVTVVDFGLADLARGAHDPRWTSPEQARRGVVGSPSDLYNAGLLGCILLTGSHPFAHHAEAAQLVAAQQHELVELSEPVTRVIGERLAALLLVSLAKSPHRRPRSAAAFREQLDDLEPGDAVAPRMAVRPPPPPAEIASPRRAPSLEATSAAVAPVREPSPPPRSPTPPPPVVRAQVAPPPVAAAATALPPRAVERAPAPTPPPAPRTLATTEPDPEPPLPSRDRWYEEPKRSRLPILLWLALAIAVVVLMVFFLKPPAGDSAAEPDAPPTPDAPATQADATHPRPVEEASRPPAPQESAVPTAALPTPPEPVSPEDVVPVDAPPADPVAIIARASEPDESRPRRAMDSRKVGVLVTSKPANARVKIGDELVGRTPMTVRVPADGSVDVKIIRWRYLTGRITLTGTEGEVHVVLRPVPRAPE